MSICLSRFYLTSIATFDLWSTDFEALDHCCLPLSLLSGGIESHYLCCFSNSCKRTMSECNVGSQVAPSCSRFLSTE